MATWRAKAMRAVRRLFRRKRRLITVRERDRLQVKTENVAIQGCVNSGLIHRSLVDAVERSEKFAGRIGRDMHEHSKPLPVCSLCPGNKTFAGFQSKVRPGLTPLRSQLVGLSSGSQITDATAAATVMKARKAIGMEKIALIFRDAVMRA
jgi:hypothetical protein